MPLLAAWMYTYRLQPTAHLVAVPGWAPCMTEEAFPSVRAPSLWCTQTKESKACHCLQPGCIRTGCNQRHTLWLCQAGLLA